MRFRHLTGPVLLLFVFSGSVAAQSVLTTIAGTDWLFPADGLPAIKAPLNGGLGLDVATDANGNLYVCDVGNEMVFRTGADGIISVIAGNGFPFPSGDGGLAVNAGMLEPQAVAVDSGGNVYIGSYTGQIRKVTPDGNITTIAGGLGSGFSGDGGPATNALLSGIGGLAVDGSGNIYVADTNNQRIRKITPDGIIHTIAGGGTSASDGIAGTSAQLMSPNRLALDGAGNLYIADVFDARVRKVDAKGIITTAAGGGFDTADGVAATTEVLLPGGITFDHAGNLYVVDLFSLNIRKVDTNGVISTIAGNGEAGYSGDGGQALKAAFHVSFDSALATDTAGNLYVADDSNGRIRRIDGSGIVTTVAGNGLFRFSGDGGPAATATLNYPSGLAGDQAGNIYLTEPFANRVRRIAADGTISVVAGNGSFGYSGDGGPATAASLALPEYVAVAPDGSVVFSDAFNCVIRSVDSYGNISTIAGSRTCGFGGDLQTAAKSEFSGPEGVDYDSAGDLLIADTENNRIRGIVATGPNAGQVLTLAGNGTAGYSGDGGLAPNKAEINHPSAIRAHGNGLYFCDTRNNVVRYVDFSTFFITTVAGNGTDGYSGDGGPAVKASLSGPSGLAFDSQGNMYIADANNSVIRRVDSNGTITTIAGNYGGREIGDGLGPLAAFIGAPTDLYFRPNGDLVFTDIYYQRVREILNALPSVQVSPGKLAFTAAAGSPSLNQTLDIGGSITGIPYTVSTDSSQWLSIATTSGGTPADVGITVNPSSLSPGSYNGTITVATPNATPHSIAVPVALTVTAPGQPSLSVNPSSITFPFVRQAPAATRQLTVSNTGGGSLPFSVTASAGSGGQWLQASTSGATLGALTLGAFGSATVSITANPASLGPGTYEGVVTVASSSGGQSIVVPVTMTITAVSQTIQIPQSGLSFFAVQGGGSPPPQDIDILNAGSGQMPWSVAASTLAGGSWLAVFPQTGETDAASSIVPQVRVNVNPAGLSAGTYYGMVKVSSSGASNNPQVVSIVFTVLPAGTNLGPIEQPSGMIFSSVAGGESPGSRTVTLQSTNSAPVTFTSGVVTANGSGWIKVAPAAGTITESGPAHIVIQPDTTGLTAGIYRGSVTFSFSDGNTRTLSVLLVVIPAGAGSVANSRLSVRAAQAPCIPTTLAPLFTGLSDGSPVQAGYPGNIEVQVVDDCANPMTSGGVTVSFSNNDPPLALASLKNGSWAATWVVGRALPQIVVKALAAIPAQNLKGQTQITVGAQTADSLPVISPGGVVNAASFAPLAPVAPGSIVAIFGTKLAQGQTSASSVPLPASLGGANLIVGGQQAPLFFTSDGQVNAMIPFGTAVNTQQQAIASRSLTLSVPQPVTVAAAAPGVFTLDGKQGIVVDIAPSGAATLVDSSHPATMGDALVIYCTGLGEVDPPVATGDPSPVDPLSRTVNAVTVTIGAVNANVLFAGLTPTQVGLYQVNVTIPTGLAAGTQVPLVVTAAGQSSAPVTINVR